MDARIRNLFHNGHKIQLVSTLLMVVIGSIIVLDLLSLLPSDKKFAPVTITAPIHVSINSDKDMDTLYIESGSTIWITRTVCNSEGGAISGVRVPSLIAESGGNTVLLLAQAVLYPPGCSRSSYSLVLPNDLASGTYHIQVLNVIQENKQQEALSYATNRFIVFGAQ